jgi:hypothetical protein
MLKFKISDTTAEIINTLDQNITLVNPNYLFVFTHVTTKAQVIFVKLQSDDTSLYQMRYNSFIINPSVLFAGTDPGEWHYTIYQQISSSNLNPALAQGVLEYGKLYLDRAVDYSPTVYDAPTSFKVYN